MAALRLDRGRRSPLALAADAPPRRHRSRRRGWSPARALFGDAIARDGDGRRRPQRGSGVRARGRASGRSTCSPPRCERASTAATRSTLSFSWQVACLSEDCVPTGRSRQDRAAARPARRRGGRGDGRVAAAHGRAASRRPTRRRPTRRSGSRRQLPRPSYRVSPGGLALALDILAAALLGRGPARRPRAPRRRRRREEERLAALSPLERALLCAREAERRDPAIGARRSACSRACSAAATESLAGTASELAWSPRAAVGGAGRVTGRRRRARGGPEMSAIPLADARALRRPRAARTRSASCSRRSCSALAVATVLLAGQPRVRPLHICRPARTGSSCSTSPRASPRTRTRGSARRSPTSRRARAATASSCSRGPPIRLSLRAPCRRSWAARPVLHAAAAEESGLPPDVSAQPVDGHLQRRDAHLGGARARAQARPDGVGAAGRRARLRPRRRPGRREADDACGARLPARPHPAARDRAEPVPEDQQFFQKLLGKQGAITAARLPRRRRRCRSGSGGFPWLLRRSRSP